jgi:hypothetical protein
MSSFRVYRVYKNNDFGYQERRVDYVFSIVVSDDAADFVVNPAISPEYVLKYLRERLERSLGTFEEKPANVEDWSRVATGGLALYQKLYLVLDVDTENEPLADFDTVLEREEAIIEDWIARNVEPPK